LNTVWAVVPLKSPDNAKSRLAGVLDAASRRALFFAMARHVLQTLRATAGIERVLVVTTSPEVARRARELGAEILLQPHEAGTAQACRFALASGVLGAHQPVLFVSGDLPLISTHAITALLQHAAPAPSVVIAPDRRRQGTNALWCSAANVIAPSFGPGSYARHIELARERGIAVTIHAEEALGLDIDDVADLRQLRSAAPDEWREWLDAAEQVAAQ
jgi:2-phospho-L-lactate/phosphoenolpyruvate guanylyltransferase